MESRLVSIITPAFNSYRWLSTAIESVLEQSYDKWEMLIVDDASSDETYLIGQEYSIRNPKVKITRLKHNVGAAEARNIALRKAQGRYVAFLDADDYWEPSKLETQLRIMKELNSAFSFTAYNVVDENGATTGKVIDHNLSEEVFSYQDMLAKKATIGCSTVILDRVALGSISMPPLRSGQDYALWLSILKKGQEAYCIPEVLSSYRLVKNSLSSNKIKKARRQWQIYREYEKISFDKAVYYFVNYAVRAIIR